VLRLNESYVVHWVVISCHVCIIYIFTVDGGVIICAFTAAN